MGRLTERYRGTYIPVFNSNSSTEPFNDCVEKLGRLEELEEQGRLIILPCAVNTELYFVGEKTDGTYGVYSTTLFTLDLCKSYEGKIGKGFYLTKEEAEARLKELKG